MDTYEATKVVMSRIQSLDPESASKIMGYILIQDQGEKEIIRLAFVPDSILLSFINQAKACLGISSSNPSNSVKPSPRILIPNNGFHFGNPSPSRSSLTPSLSPSPSPSPMPFSYAAALNGSTAAANNNCASSFNFYGGGGGSELPFLDDSAVDPVMSPSGRSDSIVFPYGEESSPHPFHRRSSSVNDAAFLANLEEGGGFGWRPCMYFARGFCKNGSSCKFLHGDGDGAAEAGSPGKSGFDELLRMKALQQQRFALMASRGQQHFSYNKCMDFLNESPRNEFSGMGMGTGATSSSRQIYLTFPADSTFKEEDVSGYFSMFGPVQDVRIPFQQKRMFGFVTFVYPETVKLILAKGNPHFVCDSRVLVKPYKEKGKVAEKKQQQQQHHLDLSSSVIDSRDNMDLPFGSRMLFNTQEMMLRRKLEQEAELQHALELQGRRMMNLQLMDLKNQHHNHHLMQGFRAGVPTSSPRQSQFLMNQNFIAASDGMNQENSEEFDGKQEPAKSSNVVLEGNEFSNNTVGCDKQQHNINGDDSEFSESLDHILPDNLFASPTKSAGERRSVFSEASASACSTDDSNIPVTMTYSNNHVTIPTMASLKSCFIEIPRFSSGQEAIEM